ncbi:hypothetical protein [Agrococcus sp. ARC_14]|uniref:hypothetical protein n=1 Tax=Agrococcus sp. ARC_14 TaxID=2919927 RepID=UPI001F068418|nr:hypothetical protein [Agrococcus sp. ARC_14]MCH1881537.1 hypothetical protein [Agrococcus sp. ARC_14]
MDFGFGPHVPFLLLGALPWLLLIAGAVTIAVLGLRALFSISRSLKQIVEQGVARGEGPFLTPSTS